MTLLTQTCAWALLVALSALCALTIRVTWHTLAPRTRQVHAEFPLQELLIIVPLLALALWAMVLLALCTLPLAQPLVLGLEDLRRSLYLSLGWTALCFVSLWITGTRLPRAAGWSHLDAAWMPMALGLIGAQIANDLMPRLQFAPLLSTHGPTVWTVAGLSAAGAGWAAHRAGTHRRRWLVVSAFAALALTAPRWAMNRSPDLFYMGAPSATLLPWVALCIGTALVCLLGAYLLTEVHARQRHTLLVDAELPPREDRQRPMAAQTLPQRVTAWLSVLHAQIGVRDELHARLLARSRITCWMVETSKARLHLDGSLAGELGEGEGHPLVPWLAEHLHPDEVGTLQALLAYEPGQRNGFELRCRMRLAADPASWGFVRWQGRMVNRDAIGYPQKWVGVMIEEGQSGAALQGLGAENRLFSEGPVVMMRWLFSPARQRITELDFISPNVEDLWGHELEQLHSMNRWSQVVASDDVPALLRRLSRAMRRRSADLHMELRIQLRDGRRVWHSLFARVEAQGDEGIITGFIVDIDSFKREEQRAREQTRQLEELIHELERAKTETVILRESSEFLNSAETLDEAFSIISRAAMAIFPGWAGVLAGSQEDGSLQLSGRWGAAEPFAQRFMPDECWALRRSQTHHFVDASQSLRCRHVHAVQGQAERPYLCIPMAAHGETVGSLHLMSPRAMDATEMQALIERSVQLGETLKLALSNLRLRTRLRQEAIHDGLTGLYNRRHMDEQLSVEIRRAERERQPLSLAMIDVDHFKRFNDSHGHEAGDTVLKALGELLRASVRPYDLACRYGGEEMAVIMPGCTLGDAAIRLEALREAAAQMPLLHHGRPLPSFTISIGLAQTRGELDEHSLLKLADEQLYRAKRLGRNQLCVNDA